MALKQEDLFKKSLEFMYINIKVLLYKIFFLISKLQ